MTIEGLKEICEELPQVTSDMKWEDHLCFNVGGKMFLITAPNEIPQTASFKVDDEEFETLIAREGLEPAPYLARYKWVKIDNINRLTAKEWRHFVSRSFALIASRLPAKIRKELAIV